jgi:hypothetical protein
MQHGPWSILLFIAVLNVLTAGCLNSIPGSSGTPVTVPSGAVPETTSPSPGDTCSLTPGPFQHLPEYEDVSITVDRNTINKNPTITVRFDGGRGLGMVQTMTVTVIRSDCVTEQEVRKKPGIGTSVTLMGTTGTDRVIVTLLMTSGDQYTVIDAGYPFPIKI